MNWTEKDLQDFRDLRAALDGVESKRLAKNAFSRGSDCCAIRVFADYVAPELKPTSMDTLMADGLGVSKWFVSAVIWENDMRVEVYETPEQRWQRMRNWVDEQLQEVT